MARKKSEGALLRACLDEIDGAEAEAIADALAEFGLKQICDPQPQAGDASVSPQSSQTGKRKMGKRKVDPTA